MSNGSEYPVPAGQVEIEYQIKKSRFLARVGYAESREQALELLQQARIAYPDARHHCWAYRVGAPHSPDAVAMSDDGEPTGTAGRPILNVLEHKQIGDVMLVVSRYFGGIKLGAGGLVRAYGQASQLAIEALKLEAHVQRLGCEVRGDFALEQNLRHWLQGCSGELISVEYGEGITCRLSVPSAAITALQAFCDGRGANFRGPTVDSN